MQATPAQPSWTRDEVAAVYHTPVLALVARAGEVHRQYHEPGEVQVEPAVPDVYLMKNAVARLISARGPVQAL